MRAKADEADEEQDPLVRRKEELVVAAKEARSREDARAERVARRELLALCADFEAKNEELFRRLPPELWEKIVYENVQQNDVLALAMTCRFFRDSTNRPWRQLETNLGERQLRKLQESGKVPSHTFGWFWWVCDTFEILPGFEECESKRVKGAVYETDLVNYAAFQGSIEILRWLVEEKGCDLNVHTGWRAGVGGSVEVLEYIVYRGYEFDAWACAGAARGGNLEALKFLRGLDPPCPLDENTCSSAAWKGHLDVLKWLRSQDPPCPWHEWTCINAATGGQLEVLKWLRSQDPPCPWSRRACLYHASNQGRYHVIDWIEQQEDESDAEYSESSDSDSDS
ncbi:hypothetical protein HKI87_10g64550 [Chloropicon roscoffensis]|uniref:F-box domain-containing protein n=1 Tax=Chloropicon roscoffensis TaxID=1461544 RepID=A0AAX4PFC0_9CHLO